ncbi:MAG: NAD-dependent epimerase/dehydratase family protein [Chromatiales bacterium]|jgi:UDP-glucose 4-epimerase|nr:NAD-dependent epimerase/dehydratase family protein [Chromatiales bacterium]
MSTRPVSVVTGGAGFIGSHMVDLLIERDHDVRIVDNMVGGHERNIAHHSDNPRVTLAEADIRALVPGNPIFDGAQFVFHFAGIGDIVPSIERPTDYMDVNVQGTVRVLECARAAHVEKLVYAASSSCYGLAEVPTREDHPVDPLYPYALSKYQGEQAVFHWHQVYKLPVNTIRIFNAYGTRVRTTGAYGAVFGVFLRQKLANQSFTVVGNGTQRRDFLYVTDVAEAFHRAATSPLSGETWNLGAGNPQPVNRLVELLGGDVVNIPKRPGEPDCTWADTGKIKRDLDWEPCISFEEGVGKILACIEDWREAPLWDPASIAEATEIWFQHLAGEKQP